MASKAKTYFITDGVHTKIGISTNVDERVRTLQTSNPRPLQLVAVLPGGRHVEAALHARFEKQRVHGEWFDLNEQQISKAVAEWQERLATEALGDAFAEDTRPKRRAWDLSADTLRTMATRWPQRHQLAFDESGDSYVYLKGEEGEEKEPVQHKGVHRTLDALAGARGQQECYEVLLQAAVLDAQYRNNRTRYLDSTRDFLVTRRGERVIARSPELAGSGVEWAGRLVQGNRCAHYLPLVTISTLMLEEQEAWASPRLCLLAMWTSYQRLGQLHTIRIPRQF